MTRRVRVNVTARDIALGKRRENDRCPIALAVRRHAGTRTAVVGTTLVRTGTHVAELPDTASVFRRHFDYGWPVVPFHFMLDFRLSPLVVVSTPLSFRLGRDV